MEQRLTLDTLMTGLTACTGHTSDHKPHIKLHISTFLNISCYTIYRYRISSADLRTCQCSLGWCHWLCFDKNHLRYQWPLVCAKCNLRPGMIVTNVLRLGYFMLSVFLWWPEVESILWLLYEDIGKMVPFIDHTALFAGVWSWMMDKSGRVSGRWR